MKLYFDPLSTPSRGVLFFLHDQGIPFEEVRMALTKGDNLTEVYRRINPTQLVPVLDDKGFVLTESAAILQYLADKHAPETLPQDARSRAQVIEALNWFGTNYATYCNLFLVYVPMLPKFAALNSAAGAEFAQIGKAYAQRLHDVLEARFEDGRPFACGAHVSIADYFGAAQVSLSEAAPFDRSVWPLTWAWLARMRARDGWLPANATFEGMLRAMRTEKV
ncbi:MAG: glutathione S-transferase family protein [Cypionkella sp.]